MAKDTAKPSNHTQSTRRAKYGLNVLVAVAAAVAIVILLNWIGNRHFQRFDFTATRQYSLSPQTLSVLDRLEGEYRVVSLLSNPDTAASPVRAAALRQAGDLVDEYGRFSDAIEVQAINPNQISRLEAFYLELLSRFEERLAPAELATRQGLDEIERLRASIDQQLALLRTTLEDGALQGGELKDFITQVAENFARFNQDVDAIEQQVTGALDSPLPDFASAKNTLQGLLDQVESRVLAVAMQKFTAATQRDDVAASVLDNLLRLNDAFDQTRASLRATVEQLGRVEVPEAYQNLRTQLLSDPDTIVVLSPERERVLALGQLFREPDPRMLEPGETPELRFQGEEKLTGALVSLSMTNPPLVVFVSTGRRPALGSPNAPFEPVAQRLRNVNFQVESWNPQGGVTPFGQPKPPGEPPTPRPGQKAVWIVLPFEDTQPNPMNPMAGQQGKQQIADLLVDRLAEGDAALIHATFAPTARFGQTDPISQLLMPFGITAQTDRVAFQQQIDENGRAIPMTNFEVTQWPDDLSITEALGGMTGVFLQASPLQVGGGSAKTSVLARIAGNMLWAETDLAFGNPPEYSEAESASSLVVAAASERNGQRIVVVGDPVWAARDIVTYGMLGPGSAELTGARFPANSELFMNSVYWLAGLDELIAASPRTQDIRRIEPITDRTLLILRWVLLAGLPVVVLMAGVGVWLTRRS